MSNDIKIKIIPYQKSYSFEDIFEKTSEDDDFFTMAHFYVWHTKDDIFYLSGTEFWKQFSHWYLKKKKKK